MGQSSGVESHGYQAGPLDPAVHPIPLYYVDYVGFVVYNVLESHEYQPKKSNCPSYPTVPCWVRWWDYMLHI